MMIKEMYAKAGSLSGYFGYIILLFGWNIFTHIYATGQLGLSGAVDQVLDWGLRLLVSPIVYAVVLGGIHERQKIQDEFERSSFLNLVKSHLWRLIGANTLSYISSLIVALIVLLVAGSDSQIQDNNVFIGIISASLSTINLFWFSAIVVERKIFRGLFHSMKTLLFNPRALVIGILWGVSCLANSLIFDFSSAQIPLVINLVRSGVFAVLKVLVAMYVLALYKNHWGSLSDHAEGEQAPGETSTTRPGEKLAKASFGFTFVSFLPLLHLVALILGLLAVKRSHRFVLRAAIACWVGGFFTILYFVLIAGLFVGRLSSPGMPGYEFLANANSDVGTYVKLLDQGAVQEIQTQLGNTASNDPDRHWAFDTALALAKLEDNDLDGALRDFYTALQKKPERSEFYFYYGVALLNNENEDMAVDQFRLALQHDPKLKIAEQYIALIQTAYQPSVITSAIMYIIILVILFALHEYGHAFAAWKLGDDTAKNLGRLTLNPLVHLDVFGSILLPAILILSNSDGVFGWAKPVPVNPANFKNPNRDHMLVSFAGPAVNLMVSMVCLVTLGLIMLFVRMLWPETISMNLAAPFSSVSIVGTPLASWILMIIVFLKQLFYTSLILGFFNLLPVPPLDGSWIFSGLLPQGLRNIFEKVRRFRLYDFRSPGDDTNS